MILGSCQLLASKLAESRQLVGAGCESHGQHEHVGRGRGFSDWKQHCIVNGDVVTLERNAYVII